MRALISSLISDALMDMCSSFLIQEFGGEPVEPASQRTIDHQIVGTQNRAAEERGIDVRNADVHRVFSRWRSALAYELLAAPRSTVRRVTVTSTTFSDSALSLGKITAISGRRPSRRFEARHANESSALRCRAILPPISIDRAPRADQSSHEDS